jgi:hypothetical protein
VRLVPVVGGARIDLASGTDIATAGIAAFSITC